MESNVFPKTSARITCPTPPPNWWSSTVPYLSIAKSLIFIVLKDQILFLSALPTTPSDKVPGNVWGKRVKILKNI